MEPQSLELDRRFDNMKTKLSRSGGALEVHYSCCVLLENFSGCALLRRDKSPDITYSVTD
jgi:hypothetical protein